MRKGTRGWKLAVFSFPREMLALPVDLVAPLLRRVAQDLDSYRHDDAARLSAAVMQLS